MKRNLNLDLLRIISMMMVVCLHTLNHGGLVENSLKPFTFNFFTGNVLFALSFVSVNCFVMISE